MKQQIRHAITEPLGLPVLSQMFFPDDRILIVPDADYAAEAETLADIVNVFQEHGLRPDQAAVLLTDADERRTETTLKPMLPEETHLLFHRPGRLDHLARLGVNESDEPILLCRELVDADLILSVGKFYSKPPKHHFGLHSAIFPRFSDAATQQRFQTSETKRRRLTAEADEVARLLGIIFTIQFSHERGKPVRVAAGLPNLVAETLRTEGAPVASGSANAGVACL